MAFSFLILRLLDYAMKIMGRGVILMSPVFHFLCLLGIFVSVPNCYCDWEEVQSCELCLLGLFPLSQHTTPHSVREIAFVRLLVKQIQKQVVSKTLCSVVCCDNGKSTNKYNSENLVETIDQKII
jgi:hypothetical protein